VRVTFQSREATLTDAQIADFSGRVCCRSRKAARRATPRAIKTICNSHARSRIIRPFQLNRVAAEDACFPRANVPILALLSSIPSLAGHRIGDCFAMFDDNNGEIGDICAWKTRVLGGYTIH